jgi:hypothetical protein
MRLAPRLLLIAAVGVVLGVAVELLWPGRGAAGLVALGAGVVAGELLVLRPPDRAALPCSYAVFLVLVRAGSAWEFAAVVLVAEAAALVAREPEPLRQNLRRSLVSALAAFAAWGVYSGVHAAFGTSTTTAVLSALAAAAVAEIAVDDLMNFLATRKLPDPVAGRSADLALIASGVLMSFGYAGTDAHAGIGLWGPVLLSIPLLAAWYSFVRLESIRHTYEQTIAALAIVPELAEVSEPGHAARVADLSVRVGTELGLSRQDLEFLRAAASLHHLGHLCLDDESTLGRPIEADEIAERGAEMLRQTEYLAPAGDFLAVDSQLVGGQILRLTSAYDDITRGNPALARTAIERLALVPGQFDDPRVLLTLERVVVGTGVG